VVVAGRAGERVQSAALLAADAACAAGLQATVRTDNPVTQGAGFSLAELTVAPHRVAYIGLREPDLLLVTAPEGQVELAARGLMSSPAVARHHVLDAQLTPPPGLEVVSHDLRKRYGGKSAALGGLMQEIDAAGWWGREAWSLAIARLPEKQQKDALATLGKIGQRERVDGVG
jgi:hypothetical protein